MLMDTSQDRRRHSVALVLTACSRLAIQLLLAGRAASSPLLTSAYQQLASPSVYGTKSMQTWTNLGQTACAPQVMTVFINC